MLTMRAGMFLHNPSLLVAAGSSKGEQSPEIADHSSSLVFFEMDLGKKVSLSPWWKKL